MSNELLTFCALPLTTEQVAANSNNIINTRRTDTFQR